MATADVRSHNLFGKRIKQLRQQQLLGLRELCRAHGFDAANHSRLETGRQAPPVPGEPAYNHLATALGVAPGTEEWIELADLAYIDRGELPVDLRDPQHTPQLLGFYRLLRQGRAAAGAELSRLNTIGPPSPTKTSAVGLAAELVAGPAPTSEPEPEPDPSARPPKVRLRLVGLDGNAFALLGEFQRAARRQGWSQDNIRAVMEEAKSGDYDHLLCTLMENCVDPEDDGEGGQKD